MNRRYDIDWLRVIAIALLLIYHVAIGFQPWGIMIGFITNKEAWSSLWLPMAMLNIWRIPFLFFVSGMGVYFAMQQRDWKALLKERALRILLPYVFGMFCIFPISLALGQYYNQLPVTYSISPGHLWFLGNIFSYVVILAPVLYALKSNQDSAFVRLMRKVFSHPAGLLIITGLFVGEAYVLKPFPYEMYAMTWHGFTLGFLAFLSGFCLVLSGQSFWNMLLRWRWMFPILGVAGFVVRVILNVQVPMYALVAESHAWIFTCFAFGYKYLNRPGRALRYLSEAAYPVYILHMIFLYAGSILIFPLTIAVEIKFFLLLLFTTAGCFASYEIIRRLKFLRPLFGLKWKSVSESKSSLTLRSKQQLT
ncbi:acyltransferase family protein [Chryseolinea sp. T2]|uniref:acyltransferase family protein n=1 Tax=Chryseolinea sp. T2 TaxID=3129255 RepID=UPI003077A15B